jgi:predicted nucleic acid-binding protein
VVVDASIVVAAIAPEDRSEEATQILARCRELLAPDLLPYEITSALFAKIRRGEIEEPAADFARETARRLPVRLLPAGELDELALRLALRLDHSTYDCFYLAAALARDAVLATFDQPLITAVQAAGFGKHVLPLD